MIYMIVNQGRNEIVGKTEDFDIAICIAKQFAMEDDYKECWAVLETNVIFESDVKNQGENITEDKDD